MVTEIQSKINDAPSGDGRIGPFVIGEELDGSLYSQVFRVRHQPINELLVPELGQGHASLQPNSRALLKIVREEHQGNIALKSACDYEARLLVTLDHPSIVRSFAKGMHNGRKWIALEYIDGMTTKRLCQSLQQASHRLHPDLVVYFISEMAHALVALHSFSTSQHSDAWIAHGGIAPRSIMVDAQGQFHLFDFDRMCTALYQPQLGELQLERWAYQSPESLRGENAGPAGDVYSLGLIAHELLTGCPPFSEDMTDEERLEFARQEPRLIWSEDVEIPLALQRLVSRMIEPTPQRRVPNGMLLRQQIDAELQIAVNAKESMALLVQDSIQQNAPAH